MEAVVILKKKKKRSREEKRREEYLWLDHKLYKKYKLISCP